MNSKYQEAEAQKTREAVTIKLSDFSPEPRQGIRSFCKAFGLNPAPVHAVADVLPGDIKTVSEWAWLHRLMCEAPPAVFSPATKWGTIREVSERLRDCAQEEIREWQESRKG